MGGARLDQLDALEAVTLAVGLKERRGESALLPAHALQCHGMRLAFSALFSIWPDSYD